MSHNKNRNIDDKCDMWKGPLVLFIIRLTLVSSNSCQDNPAKVQCLALNNRFLLPRNSNCNPFKQRCRMGDLIDNRVASCTLKYSGNVQHSLVRGYKVGKLYRCLPELRSLDSYDSRVVSADTSEPHCTGVERSGKDVFTCGEKGTRCVCDAPRGAIDWKKNKCRCQYFIDFCAISNVCRDSRAVCTTRTNTVTCKCPSRSAKGCSLGINQCATDPSLCSEHNAECIELYDHLSSWTMGGKESEGYACVNVEDIKLLKRTTHYCSVSTDNLSSTKKARNHIDACCFRLLICGGEDKRIKGNIFSYRQCFCSTEFRTCLTRYRKVSIYRDLASAALRALDQLKSCDVDEGTSCNPNKPDTCRKGDLIDPKIAHCRINCKTGPLLPIGKRMCRIRQCKPPNHVEGARVIDVPDRKTSSICQAVRSLPYLCGRGDTRCVCDGKPSGLSFTDRCRCQYWPLQN